MCTVAPVTNVQLAVGALRTACDASTSRSDERTTVPETSTGSAPASRAESSAPPAAARVSAPPTGRGWLLAALLGATVLGTISNNIVNVPLRQIITDFQ